MGHLCECYDQSTDGQGQHMNMYMLDTCDHALAVSEDG